MVRAIVEVEGHLHVPTEFFVRSEMSAAAAAAALLQSVGELPALHASALDPDPSNVDVSGLVCCDSLCMHKLEFDCATV